MAVVNLSQSAIKELDSFNTTERQNVSAALSLLGQDSYRNSHKSDFNLTQDGYKIWALIETSVNLVFHDMSNGDVCIIWLSLRSKFR